jgi:hypothetical protein
VGCRDGAGTIDGLERVEVRLEQRDAFEMTLGDRDGLERAGSVAADQLGQGQKADVIGNGDGDGPSWNRSSRVC